MPRKEPATPNWLNYFENNKERMTYGIYVQKGYFYGSGIVEAGCKTLVGRRSKQSGMFLVDKRN